MKNLKIIFFTLILVSLSFTAALALGNGNIVPSGSIALEDVLFEEIPMVVLPTRLPQPITQAPAAISVITANEIAHSGYMDIWDLLRSQPGVDVFQLSKNTVGVAIRGFNNKYSNKIQVLMDGRSIFNPYTQGVWWRDQPILLEDIERIEIMRGPNSVLYGFNSFDGIINIVTKDAKDTKGVLGKVTIGTHSTQEYMGRFGDSIGNFDYRLSYARDNSLGFGDNSGKDYLDSQRMNSINFRSRYTFSDDKNLEFLTGGKFGIRGLAPNNTGSDGTIQNSFQTLRYNQKLSEDSGFFVQAYHTLWGERIMPSPSLTTGGMAKYNQFDLEFQHNFKAFERHSIVWGGNYRRNEARAFNMTDPTEYHTDNIYRTFIQDAIKITDKFTYYAGLEWEQNDYTGSDWSTRQTAMYNLFGSHYIRATYGRAYHAQGLVESYFDVVTPPLRGNPNLRRESIDAYELGYRADFLEQKLIFDFQVFVNNIHKIRDSYTAGGFSTFGNGNKATVEGVETSFEYRPYSWVKFYLNHSFLNVNDREEEYKNADPQQKVNFGTTLSMNKSYLPSYIDLKYSYVGSIEPVDTQSFTNQRVRVPSYNKLDVKIAKRLFKDAMEVSLSVLNALEPHHFEYASGSAPVAVSREVLGTIKYQF